MSLVQILIFLAFGILYGLLGRDRGRGWVLLSLSLGAVYWLQPATPIRYIDFWLPTASLGLAILVWAGTRPKDQLDLREPAVTFVAVAFLVLAVGITRYLGPAWRLTPTSPPQLPQIGLALGVLVVFAGIVLLLRSTRIVAAILALFIVGVFMTLKTEVLAVAASAWLRSHTGQSTSMASAFDLRWLGFSYIAFRLLHTLRDRISGKMPTLSLQEFLTYILFFPALTAGPIDRGERFIKDLRERSGLTSSRALDAGTRIAMGLFKKFVVADSLAVLALNPTNAAQTTSTLWLWVLLYAYGFQLYLDFGGYTDIAIGIGKLFGISLPENFSRPYLRQNITAFWNSWHMTLTGWLRAYFFNPLVRRMRSGSHRLHPAMVIFIAQLSTMILIGLWHGMTWNFALWGVWHGLGLFVHNRWTESLRLRHGSSPPRLSWQRASALGSTFLTFQFVTLGWVWFALPSVLLSWKVMLMLFGLCPDG